MNRRTSRFALAAVIVIVVAACGGGDSQTTSTSPGPTTTLVPGTTTAPEASTSSTGPAEERTFTGADGVEVDVSDTSRIVSLNGDITEIIFALGLGDSVVAVDVTTTYPPEAAALNDSGDTVGFGQQLTAEAVLRFEPTLVIGDGQIAPPEAIEQLRDAGVPVLILGSHTSLDGVRTKIIQVSQILGVPDAGSELADSVTAEIDAARTLVEDDDTDPKVAFVYVRGPQTVFIFGAAMPTQAMIEGAGAVDVGAGTGVFGPAPLTSEAIVAAAPDVIILPEAGIAALGGVDAFLELPGVAETPAGQNRNFLIYEEGYFFGLGPRTGQALTELISDLYPDLG